MTTATRQRAAASRPPSGRPSARWVPWRGRAWADMSHWERLVAVLESQGPKTTGELGHIRGIGENVRGIRREADRNLRQYGLRIKGEPTTKLAADGRKINNATYRLVNAALAPHLARTEAEVERLRSGADRGGVARSDCRKPDLVEGVTSQLSAGARGPEVGTSPTFHDGRRYGPEQRRLGL